MCLIIKVHVTKLKIIFTTETFIVFIFSSNVD